MKETIPKEGWKVTKLLTFEEVAARFGVGSTRTIRRWVDSGELPAVRLTTKTVRVLEDDVEALIRAKREMKGEAPDAP